MYGNTDHIWCENLDRRQHYSCRLEPCENSAFLLQLQLFPGTCVLCFGRVKIPRFCCGYFRVYFAALLCFCLCRAGLAALAAPMRRVVGKFRVFIAANSGLCVCVCVCVCVYFCLDRAGFGPVLGVLGRVEDSVIPYLCCGCCRLRNSGES